MGKRINIQKELILLSFAFLLSLLSNIPESQLVFQKMIKLSSVK